MTNIAIRDVIATTMRTRQRILGFEPHDSDFDAVAKRVYPHQRGEKLLNAMEAAITWFEERYARRPSPADFYVNMARRGETWPSEWRGIRYG